MQAPPANLEPGPRFFDDGGGRFGPLTDLRPAGELPAGGRTLRGRARGRLGAVDPAARGLLWVNDRWDGLDAGVAGRLRGLGAGRAVVDGGGAVVGARVAGEAAEAWAAAGFSGLPAGVEAEGEPAAGVLIDRPWGLLTRLAAGLAVDAEALEAGVADRGDGVRVHPDARVHPSAALDAAAGPIVVEAGAEVGPFVSVLGPAWLHPGAVLAPHTQVRGPASIGARAKVGGEVKGLILGPDTNKAHGGYLGDAVVGCWCNLGAGTTASNLKNTYGPVRVKLSADADREDTGRTFQGPVIGDFVKTAIGTRLPTGCVIGTGACLAGSAIAPSFVPPMTFTTDAGVAAMEEGAFLRTVGRQMARRGEAPTPELVERLRALLQRAC